MGRRVAHFAIEEEIGRGGMGVVYRATDTKLGRQVALKMMPDELVANPARRLRFIREARLAAAISHANVATVYEIGETGDTVYIALEYIDGRSLRDIMRETRIDPERAISIAHHIAQGLAVAHEAGVRSPGLEAG